MKVDAERASRRRRKERGRRRPRRDAGKQTLAGCEVTEVNTTRLLSESATHVSAVSPVPALPLVSFGTTFREKSTCLTPWWMLDELMMSMSSQT